MYGTSKFLVLEYHLFSFPIFLIGLILLLFNHQTAITLKFPIAFTFLLIPPPIVFLQQIGSDLSILDSEIAFIILKILNTPVNLIYEYGTPIFEITTFEKPMNFVIDIACSGIYSLIGFAVFALFMTFILRGPFIKKIVVLIIGVPLYQGLNILRIVATVYIGYKSDMSSALNFFHTFGGWFLVFVGTLSLLLIVEKILKLNINYVKNECDHSQLSIDGTSCQKCGAIIFQKNIFSFKKVNIIYYFTLIIIILSVNSLNVPVFSLTQGSPLVFSNNPLGEDEVYQILPNIDNYYLTYAFRDTLFEETIGQNASIFFEYYNYTSGKPPIWVGLEIGETKSVLHPWEVCLVTWPESKGG